MVMYAGRQAEAGTTDEIFYETRHPYTLGLLASLPRLDDVGDEPLVPIIGSPPSLIRRPSGCAFHPRCRFRRVPGLCNDEVPALRLVAGDAHLSACHYAEELETVTIESLRESVDLDAEFEDVDLGVPDLVLATDVEGTDGGDGPDGAEGPGGSDGDGSDGGDGSGGSASDVRAEP
jgi:oligopeptide/dipeptide ABC transporter ATP-binding protein